MRHARHTKRAADPMVLNDEIGVTLVGRICMFIVVWAVCSMAILFVPVGSLCTGSVRTFGSSNKMHWY